MPDATVSAWLETASRRHSATAFGANLVDAMIFYAAAFIEPQVVAGMFPSDHHGSICAVPDPNAPAVKVPEAEATVWWAAYLDIRGSRSAVAPRAILPPLRCGWRS